MSGFQNGKDHIHTQKIAEMVAPESLFIIVQNQILQGNQFFVIP